MKCPNCGEEMTEGALYCEYCGEDIHIVPDFEPELESNIEQTISGMLEELDVLPETGKYDTEQKLTGRQRGNRKLLILLICVICLTGLGIGVYLYHSEEYQVSQAMRYTENGAYDKAIAGYMRALKLKEGDIELRFSLAEVYLLKDNKIEYEYLLREIVRDERASEEQLDRAYGKLIAIYRAREDYQTINDLLLASNDANLLSTYQTYIAQAPEFSIKAGYYSAMQALKLTSFGAGKIYYTMDGSEPDADSNQYIMPILLEDGDYCIKAVFINDKGISSDVAVGEYHIENDEIMMPEISVGSGEYSYPVYIEVLEEDLTDIYYTTDGSAPTYLSNLYTQPIPMPIGKTVFKFARIVDGVTGNVSEKIYELKLNTEYTPEAAVKDVAQYYLDAGKMYDAEGHFDESEDIYQFMYQCVANINEVDDFYVIAVYQSSGGALTRTGTDFAVNIYTKEKYKLQQNSQGEYELITLE